MDALHLQEASAPYRIAHSLHGFPVASKPYGDQPFVAVIYHHVRIIDDADFLLGILTDGFYQSWCFQCLSSLPDLFVKQKKTGWPKWRSRSLFVITDWVYTGSREKQKRPETSFRRLLTSLRWPALKGPLHKPCYILSISVLFPIVKSWYVWKTKDKM